MKKMRRLIPAIAMLLVSAVMLSTASFAWFTISTQAEVTGMEVTATAGSSLLIVDAKAGGLDVGDFTAANGMEALGAVPNKLEPATSVNGVMHTLADTSTVDAATGKNPTGTLTTVNVDEAHGYYYDYVVAIGSAGTEVSGALKAYIDVDTFSLTLHNAVSIDFLLATTTDGVPGTSTYVTGSTVHFADSANGATDLVVTISEDIDIPLVVVDDELGEYIVVTMRVYFDGALENPNDVIDATATPQVLGTYVKNANATETPVGFDVTFVVE